MDVIAAYETVGTFQGAAEICGTTHKTVKWTVEAHRAEQCGELAVVGKGEGHSYHQVAGQVAAKVATIGADRRSGLLPTARAAGYAGSARNFRRLVAEAKQGWRRDHHRAAGRGCGCQMRR